MRGFLASSIIAAVAIVASFMVGGASSATHTSGPSVCPYMPAYDTVINVSDGREVVVAPDQLAGVIRGLVDCTMQSLTPAQRDLFAQRVGALPAGSSDPEDQAEIALLDLEFMTTVSQDDAVDDGELAGRRLLRRVNKDDLAEVATRQERWSGLLAAGWENPELYHGAVDRQADYIVSCQDAGVPVPQSIATDPHWSVSQELSADAPSFLVDPGRTDPRAWTYQADDGGFCVALLRGPDIRAALGVICTDRWQRSACFFDSQVFNKDGTIGELTADQAMATDVSSFVPPSSIGNKCKNCHLGDNPFIVNPNGQLGQLVENLYGGQGTPTASLQFDFAPFKPKPWHNPQTLAGSGGCFNCHDIAQTQAVGYCYTILEQVAGRWMPWKWAAKASHPVPLWPDDNGCFDASSSELAPYYESMLAIKAMCTGKPIQHCPP